MHEEKLGQRREVAAMTSKLTASNELHRISKPQLTPTREESKVQPMVLRALQKKQNIPSGSHESRSELQSTVVRNYLKHGPTLSAVSSGSSIRTEAIGYPKKPKVSPGDKYCACPYCAKPLDSQSLGRDANYWESHVDADIQPYVCLSEDCTSPLLFFITMNQWLDHMDAMHSEEWNRKIHMRTWHCDVDHGDEVHQFNDHADFVTHMKDGKSHHNRSPPTDTQLDSLSRRKQKTLIREDRYACPLCDCVPASIMPILQASQHKDIKRLLHKHIAQHVKALAFVSLPIFTSEDDERASLTSDEGDERRRLRRDGSKASYPSDLDDLRLRKADDFEDGSYILEEEILLRELEEYPETSETMWSDIGFHNYSYVQISPVGQEQDPILTHLSRMQSMNSPSLDPMANEGNNSGLLGDNSLLNGIIDSPPLGIIRDADNNSTHEEDAHNNNPQRHLDPGAIRKLIPEPPSSIADAYEDLELGNAPSTILGTILNRVRKQPESYEKKAKYRFGKTISTSRNAVVREAQGPSGPVSIKTIVKKGSSSTEKEAYNEINVLRRLKHPHIIHMIDWFESRDKYYIVIQHTDGDSLYERICDQGKLIERDVTSIIFQVLNAVFYLHSNLIIHQNIKPENLLYITKDDDSPIILAGFGQSAILNSEDQVLESGNGTFGYAAPEVMAQLGHNRPADIWAVGVVTYTALCGYSPFRSENIRDLMKECNEGRIIFHERYWKDISRDAKDFIFRMLLPAPERRFNCKDALAHPWIRDRQMISPKQDAVAYPWTRYAQTVFSKQDAVAHPWIGDMQTISQDVARYVSRMRWNRSIRVIRLRNHLDNLRELLHAEPDTWIAPTQLSTLRHSILCATVWAVVQETNEVKLLRQIETRFTKT